jgi:hypothetical protein
MFRTPKMREFHQACLAMLVIGSAFLAKVKFADARKSRSFAS